jgi:hypothetical protein
MSSMHPRHSPMSLPAAEMRLRRRGRRVIVAVFMPAALAFGLAACGSTASTNAPTTALATDALPTVAAATDDFSLAPPPDACTLLTQEEAETLAHERLDPPVPSGADNSQCMWTAPPTAPGVGQVQINVGDGAKKQYDIDNQVLGHTFKPVPGIGDEAYLEAGAIFVRKGDLWFSVILVSLQVDDAEPGLVKAAQLVVSRV